MSDITQLKVDLTNFLGAPGGNSVSGAASGFAVAIQKFTDTYYAAGSGGGSYVPTSGGVINGNLSVTGTITEGGTLLSSKYLGASATAADSSKFGGVLPSGYAKVGSANTFTSGVQKNTDPNGWWEYDNTSSGKPSFVGRVNGGGNANVVIYNDGKVEWGPGGSTARDTSILRTAANELTMSGTFKATNGTFSGNVSASSFLVDGIGLEDKVRQMTTSFVLGNQDWTPVIYAASNSGTYAYNATYRGVTFTGQKDAVTLRMRMPVDPDTAYYCRVKLTKKTGSGGNFYFGAKSLDNAFNEIKTDQANSFNYFVASNAALPASGSTQYYEGVISGYNLTTESNANKFDPEAKYWDPVMYVNYNGGTGDVVIERVEIWRVPAMMVTDTPNANGAGLRLPHGTDPSSPVNGDIWSTTSALKFRLNGATKSVAFLDLASTWSGQQTFVGETHFANGTYTDPSAGVGAAIKAVGKVVASDVIRSNAGFDVSGSIVIDSSRNLINVAALTLAGNLTNTTNVSTGSVPVFFWSSWKNATNGQATIMGNWVTAGTWGFGGTNVANQVQFGAADTTGAWQSATAANFNLLNGAYQIGNTTVIDSSRNWAGNAVGATKGGTGQTSFAVGDMLYASATGTISKLTVGAAKTVLVGGTTPSWATLDLTYIPDAWIKKSVRVATTANIATSGLITIDGVTVAVGDRVLVKDQTTQSQNGIYTASTGTWTRATDADAASEIAGATVNIDQGTVNAGRIYTTYFKATDTVGTTAMPWYQILDSSAAGSEVIPGSRTIFIPQYNKLYSDATVSFRPGQFITGLGTSNGQGCATRDYIYLPTSDNTIRKVDPKTGTVVSTIAVPAGTAGTIDSLWYDPFYNQIWGVTGGASGQGNIIIINISNDTATRVANTNYGGDFNYLRAFAPTPQGFFVFSANFQNWYRLNASGTNLGTWSGTYSNIYSAMYDGRYVWGLNVSTNTLYKIDPQGANGTHLASLALTTGASNRVIFDGQHAWVTHSTSNVITKVNIDGTPSQVATLNIGGNAYGIGFDGDKYLYISNQAASGIVYVVDIHTVTTYRTITVGSSPAVPFFDGKRVWLTHYGESRTQIIS